MTDREELEKAWIAVEAHCIVSPSGATPVWRDFRRDLITKFVAAKVAAVRAETLREVREKRDALEKAIGALPLPWGSNELDAPLDRVSRALDALAHPEAK